MAQVWYSATDTRDFPSTPYMPPLAVAHFLASFNLPPGTTLPQATGHADAPADHRHGPDPVVLYSPGGSTDASLDTGLVEDLVSHGYIVVTMDDTNESPEVEFPGGRLVVATFAPGTDAEALEAQQIRAADARLTLDDLAVLNSGGNPDAGHAVADRPGRQPRPVPGRHVRLVTRRGRERAGHARRPQDQGRRQHGRHVLGTAGRQRREQAVPAADRKRAHRAERPHPGLVPRGQHGPEAAPGPGQLPAPDIQRLRGTATGGRAGTRPDAQVAATIGTITPKTAVNDERAYIRAFFDKYLRNRDNHLLNGPSPRFPDISF